MRHWMFLLAMLAPPAFAQTGQLTLSPAAVSVAKGQTSAEILLTYVTGPSASAVEADVVVNLDRFGWAEAQVVPSEIPGLRNVCLLQAGRIRVLAYSTAGEHLPAGMSIPVCRMRVRAHAHAPRGLHQMTLHNAYEQGSVSDSFPVTTNTTLVHVPY